MKPYQHPQETWGQMKERKLPPVKTSSEIIIQIVVIKIIRIFVKK